MPMKKKAFRIFWSVVSILVILSMVMFMFSFGF